MASDPKLVARLETLLVGRRGEERAAALLGRTHVRPMDITGKPLKGWLMIAPAGITRTTDLRRYVDAAVEFVVTLPAK